MTTTTNITLYTEDEFRIDKKLRAVWSAMFQRCYSENWVNYPSYGGRGITVCPEWVTDKTAFVAWALANGYREGLTLDRIDNDGHYEPSNCRFVSRKQQQRNRRITVYVTYQGRTLPVSELFDELGFDEATSNRIQNRLSIGWDLEAALQKPKSTLRTHEKIAYEGRYWSLKKLADHLNLDYAAYRRAAGRISLGWEPLKALTEPRSYNTKNATLS
ncbi:hypothetical protein [Hymenobacter sp. UYCo722]|uniref:hypothetical protein n=1 Tax=Hymenobacter sp. UYCo722 TaxID=3156335 RepID=UPI0033930B2D